MSITMTWIEKTLEVKTTPEIHNHEEGWWYGKSFYVDESTGSKKNEIWDTLTLNQWEDVSIIKESPTIDPELLAFIKWYDFVTNAEKADKNVISKRIWEELITINKSCEKIKIYVDILLLPITQENNLHNKEKILSALSEDLGIINLSMRILESLIEKKPLFNDKELSFNSPLFDYLKATLKNMKQFDALYDQEHRNTLLTRWISLRNLMLLGLSPWEGKGKEEDDNRTTLKVLFNR